jgi:hypothetical protein
MKLFIVWYIASALGGAVGPMKMTFAECEKSLPGLRAYLHETAGVPRGLVLDMRCEWHRRWPAGL